MNILTTLATIDFKPLQDAITTAVTPAQVLAILSSVIGVGMGFVLMWFGAKKIVRIFSRAFQNGKISL